MIVDATNPLNATFDGLAIEGISGAEAVQQAAGSTPVVKAFNTVFASRYAAPAEQGAPARPCSSPATTRRPRARSPSSPRPSGFASLDAGSLRIRPHARGARLPQHQR